MKKTWPIEHLDCPNCAAKLESALAQLPGVEQATVNFVNKTLSITAKDEDFAAVVQAVLEKTQQMEPEAEIRMEDHEGHEEHDHHHEHGEKPALLIRVGIAAALLMGGLLAQGLFSVALFLAAYLVAGYDVLWSALRNIARGQIFDENFLMAVASIGALLMGDYAEGIAVMALYQVGEWFQDRAVDKSRASIASLMDIRPDAANLFRGGEILVVSPEEVHVGDAILVKPGEKIPLDGTVEEGVSSLNTVALTGEALPRDVQPGDSVLSGCVNLSGVLTIRVTSEFQESTVAKILRLVETSGENKAKAEKFITRFARVYTPAVCAAAVLLAVLPSLFDGQWLHWIRQALTFLVISCPCALVISVPLTFFSGIGGASSKGILVKGANYMEALAQVDTVVFDKTGTLTRGVFTVTDIRPAKGEKTALLEVAALAESYSDHPISKSVQAAYGKHLDKARVGAVEEIAGHGVKAVVDGRVIYAGNDRLMALAGVVPAVCEVHGTVVHVAAEGEYLGCIVISDIVKPTAAKAAADLKAAGVKKLVMLTGDHADVACDIAAQLGMTDVHAQLLPEDKVVQVEKLLGQGSKVAFVGDGINDAPVLRRADVGIAMGGVGSDAAIEAADVVLMDDDPGKLPTAIRMARRTMQIARQNIVFALGIKAVFLLMGVMGIANMWLAVFADVGVAMIAILNAMRAMK